MKVKSSNKGDAFQGSLRHKCFSPVSFLSTKSKQSTCEIILLTSAPGSGRPCPGFKICLIMTDGSVEVKICVLERGVQG